MPSLWVEYYPSDADVPNSYFKITFEGTIHNAYVFELDDKNQTVSYSLEEVAFTYYHDIHLGGAFCCS